MVFCIVALIVFGIMGIFSAYYRRLAKEALSCVLRTVVLKPCNTGFDDKMKAKITGKVAKASPKTAKIIYRHFKLFSWIMVIITFISLFYSAQAIYNIAVYNNCNGQNSSELCSITGAGSVSTTKICDKCGFEKINCGQDDILKCANDCDCLAKTCKVK